MPITPVDVGRGYVLGTKKLVTKINSSVCWECDESESLCAWVYSAEGELVNTQHAVGVLNLSLPLRHMAIVEPLSAGACRHEETTSIKTDDLALTDNGVQPSCSQLSAAAAVRLVSSMLHVLPTTSVADLPAQPLSLTLAAGESFSFQLVFTAGMTRA